MNLVASCVGARPGFTQTYGPFTGAVAFQAPACAAGWAFPTQGASAVWCMFRLRRLLKAQTVKASRFPSKAETFQADVPQLEFRATASACIKRLPRPEVA